MFGQTVSEIYIKCFQTQLSQQTEQISDKRYFTLWKSHLQALVTIKCIMCIRGWVYSGCPESTKTWTQFCPKLSEKCLKYGPNFEAWIISFALSWTVLYILVGSLSVFLKDLIPQVGEIKCRDEFNVCIQFIFRFFSR